LAGEVGRQRLPTLADWRATLAHRHLAGDVSRQRLGAQPSAGLRVERAHPELFRVLQVDIEVAVVAGEAAGRAEGEPAGGLVTGAFIQGGIDEALGQDHGVAVGGAPVVGQAAGAAGEQEAGEIGIMGALGQNEKAAVLRDEAQAGGALRLGPPDPAITRAQVQRGAGPTEQREPAAVGCDADVTQRRVHKGRVAQVVLGAQQGAEAGSLLGANQAQFERGQSGQSRQ